MATEAAMAVMAVMVVMVVEEGVWVRAGPLGASGRAEGRAAEKAMEETGVGCGQGVVLRGADESVVGGDDAVKELVGGGGGCLGIVARGESISGRGGERGERGGGCGDG